jgi:CDP-diacylglycerol---glycerol-3-phosphate 3-phosphatidyltransferase
MSATSFRGLSSSRHRLLEAARGFLIPQSEKAEQGRRRVLRCFPIKHGNVRSSLKTPTDFHATLCQLISSAKKRVYLASLYIGPAANPSSAAKELELLKALQLTSAPDVKILLDRNRALRPVPLTGTQQGGSHNAEGKEISSISSAEACYRAVEQKLLSNVSSFKTKSHNPGVYLLSVLPFWQQMLLKNPYNEVAGVFHLKCYIMDESIILTGANLSEEYFVDRLDRYLWLSDEISVDSSSNIAGAVDSSRRLLVDSTTSLVEHYAKLIVLLCRHAEPYASNGPLKLSNFSPGTGTSKDEMVQELTDLLTIDSFNDAKRLHYDVHYGVSVESNGNDDKSKSSWTNADQTIVAYAVPTFQAPSGFAPDLHCSVPRDTDIIASIIKTAAEHAVASQKRFQIRLASAYLNLTDHFLEMLGQCKHSSLHLMTAGFISHGFKPNFKKVGNKGKVWIPAVFDALGRRCLDALNNKRTNSDGDGECLTKLWYYQRIGWTYHAKGILLTENTAKDNHCVVDASSTCVAATHGSGNFGCRSSFRDLESNLVVIFTDKPIETSQRFRRMFQDEWNAMCEHIVPAEDEKAQRLSFLLRTLLPLIRQFF